MEKYKGFNVPYVGEFVSDEKRHDFIRLKYCGHASSNFACNGICEQCLFNKASDNLMDWHNARIKGVNGENIR